MYVIYGICIVLGIRDFCIHFCVGGGGGCSAA